MNIVKIDGKNIGKGIEKLFDTIKYFASPWIDSKHKMKMADADAYVLLQLETN